MNVAARVTGWAEGKHITELRSYFREDGPRMGMRSTFSAMIAASNGVSFGAGRPDEYDASMVDVIDGGRSGRAVWQALRRLDDQREAAVLVTLHRLYGFVHVPVGYAAAFGDEAAQLASLTNAAERAREDLAFARGSERGSGVRLRCLSWREESADKLAEDFWRAARSEARCIAKGQPVEAHAWRELQERIAAMAQAGRDAVVSAEVGALAGADRETTADEAIRHQLDGRDTSARAMFIAAVKRDAAALKGRALAAYAAARGR